MPLNLLHLSDIHFKYALDGTVFDLDHDVRNELIIDVGNVAERTGPIDAVVVTGDIAFAGMKEDYSVARLWLQELCAQVGCEAKNVWVVPGNHDIDRQKVTPLVRMVQDSMQNALTHDIDKKIQQVFFDDTESAKLLLSPMADYLEFSAKFGCKPSANAIAWQSDLDLGGGYALRLVGINSAIVSNDKDHETDRKLVVGHAQLKIPRTPGVLYLTLCHHPLNWIKDADNISEKLRNRVALQLFGHVHQHAIQQDACTLIVQAGALQPDRDEDPWYPSYNILTVEVDTSDQGHRLTVTAYPRVWSGNHHFVAEPMKGEGETQSFSLPIDEHTSLAQALISHEQVECGKGDVMDEEEGGDVRYNMNDPAKQLVYAYLTLPYTVQMRIANKLALLANEDAGLANDELFERIFKRAKERNTLSELWENTSLARPELNMGDNPYNRDT